MPRPAIHSFGDIQAELDFIAKGQATKIFDSGYLAADAASIDSGPIPGGFDLIEFLIQGRTTYAIAVTTGGVQLRFNGDSGNNYYYETVLDANAVYGGANNQATPEAGHRINMPGTTIADPLANAVTRIWIPFYDGSTWAKTALFVSGMFDIAAGANGRARAGVMHWNSAAPITQALLIAQAGGGVLKAGSRMVVRGL